MTTELSVITHCYDLMPWLLNHTSKFPRSHRFSLGQRIEQRAFELLELLLECKFTREKQEQLRQSALRVEQLRFLLRLANDCRLIANNSHHYAVARLDQIGREIGGWRRQTENRP